MNHITNDKGELVIAIGAPGSIARAEVEHPLKIETINEMYAQGAEKEEAIQFLIDNGIKSQLERDSILHHTMF